MAYKGKEIRNPVTKQDIKFIATSADTSGRLLEMEATYNTRSAEPVPHYHPYQTEDFTVLTGELTVKIDGLVKTLRAGDKLHITPNKTHAMWNNSDAITIVNWRVQPALTTEQMLETMTGLANDGKVNAAGMPGLLQLALTANRHNKAVRIIKPPYIVQRFLFSILAPIARLTGLKPIYQHHIN